MRSLSVLGVCGGVLRDVTVLVRNLLAALDNPFRLKSACTLWLSSRYGPLAEGAQDDSFVAFETGHQARGTSAVND
jgi:hypothetical protein